MAALSNIRRERFAQAFATGLTAGEAYRRAGYEANAGNAARLRANAEVRARVAELIEVGAKGVSALQLSRELNVRYKTAFVLAHKLREAMAAERKDATLEGLVEVDGAYFGGYVKPENTKEDRKDLRLAENQTGERKAVVVMRERRGRTLVHVFQHESESVETIHAGVKTGTVVDADESTSWDALHGFHDVRRVNHTMRFFEAGVCTNQAESYFSRLRRAGIGTHHHLAGPYLASYAREMAWRKDYRRRDNGTLFKLVAAAAAGHPVSRQWKGYWQRSA